MRLLCLLGLWLLSQSLVWGAVVRAVDLAEMTARSRLIFQGRVLERRIRRDEPRPYTRVVFEVMDVLKGKAPGERFVLDFAGAPAAGVVVHDLRYPEPGEEGVYFVEDPTRRLANPFYGWSQGHFRIEVRNGEAVVVAADGRPVTDLDFHVRARPALSKGVARGVRRQAQMRPLDPETFKARLRAWLREATKP